MREEKKRKRQTEKRKRKKKRLTVKICYKVHAARYVASHTHADAVCECKNLQKKKRRGPMQRTVAISWKYKQRGGRNAHVTTKMIDGGEREREKPVKLSCTCTFAFTHYKRMLVTFEA